MKAIILAAGYATRLQPLTESWAKELLPVGGRPIVDWILDAVAQASVVDEVHVDRDMDHGYTRGRSGRRIWRRSDCPKLSDRMNAYGAYDFTHGECFLWRNGWCDGEETVNLLRALVAWRAGKPGRLVLIWDNAPCHVARVVEAEAARLGIEIVNLPGYSPDLNPIERLWDWMREEVTRGFCHASVPELIDACQAFIARINRDPVALVDRLWPKFELDPEFEEKLRVST